jgi:choline dehydrogenase-like flavoprotein
MILDLDKSGGTVELFTDLCIIGSGAAGLSLANEMLGVSNTVIVESGGFEHEPATQALYDVAITGLPHPGSTQGRFRVCGGSTTKWGGQALPLMPSDFERRDWVSYSGWPISWNELQPYYARAGRFFLLDEMNFDTDLFQKLRTRPPRFDARKIWYHFAKWSPKPSIREHYLPRIRAAATSTLLLHANVVRIVLAHGLNQVTKVEIRSLNGRTGTVCARAFVLCAGGIETARLLLSNNTQQPCGIGNQHDLVGRFFQDHPSAMIGYLNCSDPVSAQRFLNVFHRRGLKYSVRCTATSQWQRRHDTLNVSMGSTFEQPDRSLEDLKGLYVAARQRRLGKVAGTAMRLAHHPGSAILPVWHFLRYRRSFAPGARIRIGLTSEQEPNPDSRILLSESTDALGMKRANVRWKLTDMTIHTMRHYAMALREEFKRAGIGEIELDDWLRESHSDWTSHINDQFHHIGTARMHDSPRQGVVDRNCQVHGVSNLYIGSSAVFPTSGHSNPTLTIIALAMRLADRLKGELA